MIKQEFILSVYSVNSDLEAKFTMLGNPAWDFLTSEPCRTLFSAWLLYWDNQQSVLINASCGNVWG